MAMFFDPYGSSGTSAFGGSTSPSLYGGLLDDTQQEALRQRGLMGFLGGMQKAGSLDYVDPFSGVRIGGLAAGLAGGAQGMLNAQDQGVLNALNAQKLGLEGQQLQFKVGGVKALMPALQKLIDQMGGAPAGAPDTSGPQTAGPGGVEPSGGIGTAPVVSSQTADATLPPEARALLDSISGPESRGAYNIRYTPAGGTTFDSFDQHPNIAEPGPQGPSTAAGRYQMVVSTYRPLAEKYGLQDFSPVSQDQGAWHLAQDTYKDKTGRDLLGDLQGGDTSRVASALQGQWPTIGRGIGSYTDNLGKYTAAGTALGGNTGGGNLAAVPDFSGMMQGHAGAPYAPNNAPVMSGSSLPPSGAAKAPTLAEGDSIGVGFTKYGGLSGNPVGGRNPQAVLGNIAANLKNDPNYYKGQTVLLSSGTMNDPNGENTDLIPEQIKTIQAAGGNVVLAGADTGKFASRNAQLAQIAQATGVPFAGALPTDNVHPGPDGYKAYVGTNAPLALRIAQNGTPAAPVKLAQNGPPTALAPAVPQAQPPMARGLPQTASGVDPRALALAGTGAMAGLYGLGDVVKPLENAFYNSPGYKGNVAAAEARAAMPFKPVDLRPGGATGLYDQNGNFNPKYNAPTLQEVSDPKTGQKSYVYMSPQGIQQTGQVAALGPGETAQLTTGGHNAANLGPLVAPQGSSPAASQPLPGTPLAKDLTSTIPDYKEPALTPTELNSRIPEWTKTSREMTASIGMAQQAEHRLANIAKAFKLTEPGAFATHKAEIAAALKSLNLPFPQSWDPATIQLALHENYRATLQNLAAVNKRFSQMEFRVTSEQSEHPNIQPSANLEMLSEDIGALRQMQGMGTDWLTAQVAGKHNPDAFETARLKANPLGKISAAVKQEIGPLKGMEKTTIPEGGIVHGPNGQRLQNRNGAWIDQATGQPYQPGR